MSIASNNSELVIRDVTSSITIFSAPFKAGPVPFGGRSIAVKLASGDVWLIPSTQLDQQTVDKLAALGPVKHLVVPDAEHTIFTLPYVKQYPDAALYVPLRTAESWPKDNEKKEFVSRITHTFGKGLPDPFPIVTGGEILSADWGTAHANEDVGFLHVPTKTFITADLLFNLPPSECYANSNQKASVFLLSGALKPATFMHKLMVNKLLNKDGPKFKEQSKVVAGWDFDRVIPCHGDVIETGGKKAFLDTYAGQLN